MVDAGIIAPIKYSSWMSNLVVVRKKNGDIHLRVDFRNLNQLSLKDNYPLPNMEHLLQRVTGAGMMSMLDGFLGYNQVLLRREDQLKTAFTMPWGTFMYLRIPFGLMNVGATFQRAMDFSFRDLIQKIIEIYQDDLTVVSKDRKDHLSHLGIVFELCRKYGISLNPKKSVLRSTKENCWDMWPHQGESPLIPKESNPQNMFLLQSTRKPYNISLEKSTSSTDLCLTLLKG
jgi:hypothetical protein